MIPYFHEQVAKVKVAIDADDVDALKNIKDRPIWSYAAIESKPIELPLLDDSTKNPNACYISKYTISSPIAIQYAICNKKYKCADYLISKDPNNLFETKLEEVLTCKSASTRIHALHLAILCLDYTIFNNIMIKMKKSKIPIEKATMSFKNTPLHTALQLYNYFVKNNAPKAKEMCELLKKMVQDIVTTENCSKLLLQTNDMNIAPIQIIMNFDTEYLKSLLDTVKQFHKDDYESFIRKKRLYMIKSIDDSKPVELTFEEYYSKIGKNDMASIFSNNTCYKCGDANGLSQCERCYNQYCPQHLSSHKCHH